ncbi:MAG TPA: PepSY domain-containing protein [Proteobacteria bacterium]|nr:PepSY domain-containing protein [Pseudomonadota bacterium]
MKMKNSRYHNALKQIHKYLGLLVLLYGLWMALSGIALNHPEAIKNLSFSNRLMPDNYQYRNWNRMSWRCAQFSSFDDNLLLVGGKEGVWQSLDRGKSFTRLAGGFPAASYAKDTFSLLLANNGSKEILFAGTRSGLYYWQEQQWQKVDHPVLSQARVLDLLQVDNLILAFTDSLAFKAEISSEKLIFRSLPLPVEASIFQHLPLFRWLRKVHDGSILGFYGKLFADGIGLILIFLSLSGLVIWYTRQRKKLHKKTIFSGKFFFFNFHWHSNLGVVSALFISILIFSGAFSFPPLLVTIVRLATPACLLADKDADNPWREQILRAAYLESRKRLIIATKNGLFSGPLDGSREFIRLPDTVPIHGMGVQVFTNIGSEQLLLGSFSGLYLWDTSSNNVIHLKAGKQANVPDWGRAIMVTGVAIFKDRPVLAVDYESGIKPLNVNQEITPQMPALLAEQSRISLWHALFELHNGRIFEQFIGQFYWLITPLGWLAFFLITLSGVLLWLKKKINGGSKRRKP